MRKMIANEWMSLDGVVQAPGLAVKDTSGGFEHGGRHVGYFDDMSEKWVVENGTAAGGFLLGRRTYEILAAYWPNASEEEQALAEPLNTRIGSAKLVQTLLEHDLVDEFRLMIEPLVLGGGKRLFHDDGAR